MTSSLLPNTPEAKHMKNSKTLNPNARPSNAAQQIDLDSCSEAELKELKEKFISDVARIRSFVKQIEARELELDRIENVKNADVRKLGSCVKKRARTPETPDRENKRFCGKTLESRKAEAAMMRKCGLILDKLMKHRHGWVFNKPVDVVALRIPDYYEVVKRPMDLGTIKFKFDKGGYGSVLDFEKDVRLTFDNAMLYNREGEEVHTMATVLLDMFQKLFDPAYEKYEAERRSGVVEEKKGKPLRGVVREDRQEALFDAAPLVKALDRKNCEEAARKVVSKKQKTVAEVKESPPRRGEMSALERDQLGFVLEDLVGEHLDEILDIVAKRNPKLMTPNGDEEIELDVHALDNETLWDLHRFARLKSMAV